MFSVFQKNWVLGMLGPPYCGIGATIRIGQEMLGLPYVGFFYLKIISSKFLILSTGLTRRRSPLKIAARWRYRLPIENLTAHYNSQFCVIFLFCPGSPKVPLNMSKLVLNLI